VQKELQKWLELSSNIYFITGIPTACRPEVILRFLFTPPEISVGTAYQFNVYHIMQIHGDEDIFVPEIILFLKT
jgi:hypothetical protein